MTMSALVASVMSLGVLLPAPRGELEQHRDTILFNTPFDPGKRLEFPLFDTRSGARQLLSVTIDVFQSGATVFNFDNDDPNRPAQVEASILRQFLLTGPGITAFGTLSLHTPVFYVAPDDGDGSVFAPDSPDGLSFTFSYTDLLVGRFRPPASLYESNGSGRFSLDVPGHGAPGSGYLFLDELRLLGVPPDPYQYQFTDTFHAISAVVMYEYTPEPGTLMFVLVALTAAARRVRRF